MDTDRYRWIQIDTDGYRWIQTDTDGYRWIQMDTDTKNDSYFILIEIYIWIEWISDGSLMDL
jgi:hypothetical protein